MSGLICRGRRADDDFWPALVAVSIRAVTVTASPITSTPVRLTARVKVTRPLWTGQRTSEAGLFRRTSELPIALARCACRGGATAARGHGRRPSEEQEHGIPAELQQVGALCVGAASSRAKLLFITSVTSSARPYPVVPGAPNSGKSGDIHEHERAIELTPVRIGRFRRPFDEQTREVGGKITAHTVLWYEMYLKGFHLRISPDDGCTRSLRGERCSDGISVAARSGSRSSVTRAQ